MLGILGSSLDTQSVVRVGEREPGVGGKGGGQWGMKE